MCLPSVITALTTENAVFVWESARKKTKTKIVPIQEWKKGDFIKDPLKSYLDIPAVENFDFVLYSEMINLFFS